MSERKEVPELSDIQAYKEFTDRSKRRYLKHLISLGYVFVQKGSYESTTYWAIHPDYYITDDEMWEKDDFVIEGTISPECYPVGAFIRINTMAESETDDPWETSYFLHEDRCSIDYLK